MWLYINYIVIDLANYTHKSHVLYCYPLTTINIHGTFPLHKIIFLLIFLTRL